MSSMGTEGRDRLLARPERRGAALGFVLAVVGPALATVLSTLPSREGTGVPALLYLLAVVAAAAVGRLWPGLVASALSFAGLDYYFTPPVHTFAVGKSEDLIALAVFLVVAAAVSAALSAALEQRARAELREHQVRALYHVTSRLLSGGSLHAVLQDLAESLRALYGLTGCRVMVFADESERDEVVTGTIDESTVTAIPLTAGETTVGRIEISGPSPPGGPEGEVLRTFAGQLALAIERIRLADTASRAQVDAEASRIRAALFSSVTHDLRTPLASITASASSLLEEGVPFSNEQRQDLLRTILEESERLNRLVANLMDLSRLRAGALSPSLEPVPLDELVGAVIDRMRPRLAGRDVRLVIRDDVPPVAMDVVQMDQVFTNLIENAAAYSPPATPITVTAVRWEGMVEVRVADRGPGVPSEERERVFQEFYRRDVDGRRSGTGLGLAIAHAIVVAHGGTMTMEETAGGGATVRFRLPLSPRESRAERAAAVTPSAAERGP
jgi:two-component system, OmpR family, sensor histidine kinase KdpD